MLMDLKLFAVSLCVLLLCDHAFTRCKMSKQCERKGGKCSRRNEVPAGFELLGTCRGKCNCYKKVESFPLYPSPMMNMANMTDVSQKDGNRTKHQMSKRCERKGGRCSCRNEVPAGFELLGTCRRKCKCYKKVESFPLYPSPMMNMTNVTDSQKDENRTKQQRTGFSCKKNEWGYGQYCKCSPGQRISVFKSVFDWWYEDRQWDLECANIIPKEMAKYTSWTTEVSSYLQEWEKDGEIWWGRFNLKDCFMVGMTSEFSWWYEDRRYKVIYSCSPNWVFSSCTSEWLNGWGEQVNHVLGSTQVITAFFSSFSTWYEDRRFAIEVCDLVPKCDQLVSITYDYDKMTTTEDEETVAYGHYDNSGGTSQNSVTATISYSQQTRLADTYSFSRTEGWSTTVSASVTLGYNWGVQVAGGSVSVTAGFSHTWDTSSTWTRTQTKTYIETHTQGITFTAKCNPRCICKLGVKVTRGKGHIPYTMITKSKGTNVDTCEEKGVLHVGRAWNANAKSDDEC